MPTKFPISLAVSLILALPLAAQTGGRLTGSVVDASGASVPNAKISLQLAGGAKAVASATTNNDGLFTISGLRPDYYDMAVEGAGFARFVQAGVKVDPARETPLSPITLQVASTGQTVEVTGAVDSVKVSTFEVASTVTQSQVENLPVFNRQVSNLFATQPGVTGNANNPTVINGLRNAYTNLTLDGINVQDNWVRGNTLDFLPNRLTISQVAEMSVFSSNSNVALGGGANQIVLVSPSGTNSFHGSAYWFNRNSYFAANEWFNNQSRLARPAGNLNQLGGSLGGPIIKDKLLFYLNYEAYRRRRGSSVTKTILTPAARQGILTYRDATGAVRQFNVITDSQIPLDPTVQSLLQQIPAVGNSPTVGDGLNTTGYQFTARNNTNRDTVTGKLDYYLNSRNAIAGTYAWNRDDQDRPDLGNFFTVDTPVSNANRGSLLSLSWRWNPAPTLTNELRGGFNRTSGPFNVSTPPPAYLLSGLSFSTPINGKLPEGRDTNTYSLQDNANWVKGRHTLSFGYQLQNVRVSLYDYANTAAVYTLGIASSSPLGYSAGDIPGLAAGDVSTANRLLQTIGGLVTAGTQSYNPMSRTSGFVAGAPLAQNFRTGEHALYASDNWKVTRRLTLVLGLRWQYYPPVNERDSLIVQPVLINNDPASTLLANATLDFAGNSVGRPLYKKYWKDFAPNVGFAWDVFGDGKTAVRGGYSIAYADDNTGNSISNTTLANSGLQATTAFSNRDARLSALPKITPPPFQIPITTKDNFNNTGGNNVQGLIDPNLRAPYVQMWSFGIQREVKGTVLEARYVGNHGVGELRQIDFNQIRAGQNGFLDDFIRARNNGFLSLAATRVFNPAYNPAIAGSQPLPVFATLPSGGLLNNSTIRGQIQTGEAGTLAQTYQTAGLNGPIQFFPNPYTLYSSLLTNFGFSSYNALQVEARRRTRSGIQFQASYSYSKDLTDAASFRGLEAVLDNSNRGLERARSVFDLPHVFKVNHEIPIPAGKGHRVAYAPLNRVIGGWSFAGFFNAQSGDPFSILSSRGTLNRGARSGNNTVDTTQTFGQLNSLIGVYQTGNGPYFINRSAVGPDGRGVSADGATPFSGQLFFNPQPGKVGSLQRRVFNGPMYWDYDCSVIKEIPITERKRLQIRGEFFNVFNHPVFAAPDSNGTTTATISGPSNVNSSSFGRLTSTASAARQIQFVLMYRF